MMIIRRKTINRTEVVKPLFESQQALQENVNVLGQTKNDDLLSRFLSNKIYQFKFSDGEEIMALPVLKGLKTKISLNYHIENSSDVDSFLQSVRDFIKRDISEYDKDRLISIYQSNI